MKLLNCDYNQFKHVGHRNVLAGNIILMEKGWRETMRGNEGGDDF